MTVWVSADKRTRGIVHARRLDPRAPGLTRQTWRYGPLPEARAPQDWEPSNASRADEIEAAIAWQDSVLPATVAGVSSPATYCVARFLVPAWSLGCVEQLATLAEVGGVSQGWSPFTAGLDTLTVRWSIRRAYDLPVVVTPGGLPFTSPVADLFPTDWEDPRFAWNTIATTRLRVLASGECVIGLYCTLIPSPGSVWTVTLAGRLAGWTQTGGGRWQSLNARLRT